jgi:hypothetical protein
MRRVWIWHILSFDQKIFYKPCWRKKNQNGFNTTNEEFDDSNFEPSVTTLTDSIFCIDEAEQDLSS